MNEACSACIERSVMSPAVGGLGGCSEVLVQLLMQANSDDQDRCERMYRSLWRTEPFRAATLDADAFEEFESGLRFATAAKQIGARPGPMADEGSIENWYERVEEIAADLLPSISGETLLVELTNYKGEGEGLAIFDFVKHLPVFISKQRSAELSIC